MPIMNGTNAIHYTFENLRGTQKLFDIHIYLCYNIPIMNGNSFIKHLIGRYYMNGGYTWERLLTIDGRPTRYVSVLSVLANNGPTGKYDILKTVWNVKLPKEHYRGHMSNLFASMRRGGIVVYDHRSRKWSITYKGISVLENAKREWGRRYADEYWRS